MEVSIITKSSVIWVVIASVYLQAYTSICCLEQEKVALLHLKSCFLSISSGYYRGRVSQELRSWGGEDNCCMWERVTCSSPTQHVIQLSLNKLMWPAYYDLPINNINFSLFQPFVHLRSLDLSSNNIGKFVEYKGNTTFRLRNTLELLDVHDNLLRLEEAADFLGSLPKLKKLLFNENLMCSGLGLEGLSHLKWLQVLNCSDHITPSVYMTEMELPCRAIANMTSLQVLDLSNLDFGTITHAEGLCKLSNLQELRLQSNVIVGSFPECFWNLTSLRIVNLLGNTFSGTLPSYINLPSLEWLSISGNNFRGKISLNSLMNHSRLEVLLLSNNALELGIEDASGSSSSMLRALELSQCNLIGQVKAIETILSYQSKMEYIDLSSNRLAGSFPKWLLQNNSNLKFLDLRNTSLTGSFQLPEYSNMSVLFYLDISSNNLRGRLPNHIGILLSSLQLLSMSVNSFEEHIPASVGNMTRLMALDLSDNIFSGELPRQLFSDCTYLENLLLSKNNLRGEIIPSYMNLTFLELLNLDNNNFSGTIKESLRIATGLSYLDISNNKAIGELPSWIGDYGGMSSLSVLGNEFHGHIPSQLCNLTSLVFLDLSKNRFTGKIPSCSSLSSLLYLYMDGNSLTGAIPTGLRNSSVLKTLDLRNNMLSGGIPPWIDELSWLVILLLGSNQLGGGLPIQLCQLQHVNIVDISDNSISGVLPSCLRNLSFGALKMDYSYDFKNTTDVLSWGDSLYRPKYDTIIHPIQEEAEFIVKSRLSSYTINILSIMSLLDLSCNNLIGDIPPELGELGMIHAMNLSHNFLSGSIPRSFSKLKNIESLDLSSNNLSGSIPSQLHGLTFLAVFNVSYNNLSGEVPETGQFGSFDESSYRGNPLLCGSQLPRRCGFDVSTMPPGSTSTNEETNEGDSGFDMEVFIWSFVMSAVIVFLSFIVVLAINPYWRRAWSAFIDVKFLWWFHP